MWRVDCGTVHLVFIANYSAPTKLVGLCSSGTTNTLSSTASPPEHQVPSIPRVWHFISSSSWCGVTFLQCARVSSGPQRTHAELRTGFQHLMSSPSSNHGRGRSSLVPLTWSQQENESSWYLLSLVRYPSVESSFIRRSRSVPLQRALIDPICFAYLHFTNWFHRRISEPRT